MNHSKVLIVILTLSLAALACSLAPETGSQSNPASLTAEVIEPTIAIVVPTSTPKLAVTSVAGAETADGLNESTSTDLDPVADSAAERAAITDISDIQNIEMQLYVPNCTPRTDWELYRVVAGDTLSSIARRHTTSWQALADANCLANPSLIYVGQGLHVPRRTNPPNDIPIPPIIDYPAGPSPMACNVFVRHPQQSIPVYAGPNTNTGIVAHLVDYAPRVQSNGDFYQIAFPYGGGTGWVSRYVTLLSGSCGPGAPVFNNPGEPPAAGCSAVPAAPTVPIYYGSGIIGHLGNFAPIIRYQNSRYAIAIKGWHQEAWVHETEVALVGSCSDIQPPTVTWTPVPPSPTWTPTPASPLDELPRIANPGIPPQDQCAVVVNQGVPAPVYPDPISVTGPIAVLENYAFALNIIEDGYVIPLAADGRQGWVSASDTHLKGDCSSVVPFDPS